MSIYVWKLGEIALARISKQVYAKVQVVKNEEGLFHDNKVLGISSNQDGSMDITKELCYHVEISRTGQHLWLPYTSLHLAERSRPFYGKDKMTSPDKDSTTVPKKRKIIHDHVVPLEIKFKKNNDSNLNITYDARHNKIEKEKYDNCFADFMRRGKEMLFDFYYMQLKRDVEQNKNVLDYLKKVNICTEVKFEAVIRDKISENEIDNYLRLCWRYNYVGRQSELVEVEEERCSSPPSPEKAVITQHTPWCLICGDDQGDILQECSSCPSSFHLDCRQEWLITVTHRKNPQSDEAPPPAVIVNRILSSTRTISSVKNEMENSEQCPSCNMGPRVGYDDVVWYKLGSCPWWPARVVAPGTAPSCLLASSHDPHQWPLRYYGTGNYSWGDRRRMSLFLPSHTAPLRSSKDPILQQAVMDACDEYITVYLT